MEHPAYGWIPFTASENDPETMGQAIYAYALELGPAEYVPPEPEPTAASAAVAGLRRLFRWPRRTTT
ncbi:MAG: hypothetical protein U1E58_10215 [Tabrizicola sp.]